VPRSDHIQKLKINDHELIAEYSQVLAASSQLDWASNSELREPGFRCAVPSTAATTIQIPSHIAIQATLSIDTTKT
jgi:hypothetical protein